MPISTGPRSLALRRLTCALAGSILVLAASPTLRADDVFYASSEGESRLPGQIVEYTGREIVVRQANGRDQPLPADKVLRIEFTRTAEHAGGDRMAAERNFAAACDQYTRALEADKRPWVQRMLASRLAVCWAHRQREGGIQRAGDLVLTILRHDPDSPYFPALPLHWIAEPPEPDLERKAETWFNTAASPAAQLLGASWLATSPQRVAARQMLETLTANKDPRVALLATAQLWRFAAPTAIGTDVERWEQILPKIPIPLRAGPYYLIGRGWAARKKPEQSVLALLRVPIDYPDEGRLAAAALVDAAREVLTLGQREQAAGLYREVIERHAETLAAVEAKQALEAMRKSP